MVRGVRERLVGDGRGWVPFRFVMVGPWSGRLRTNVDGAGVAVAGSAVAGGGLTSLFVLVDLT